MAIRSSRVVAAVAAAALGLGGVAVAAAPASAAACKTIKLAYQGPITGANGALGVAISNGAVLAVDQYNAKKPKVRVELVKKDTQGAEDQGPIAAKAIIGDACIIGVVGPTFSGETLASGALYNRAGLPLISASATNPTITTKGWKVFHRAVATDAMVAAQTAKLLKSKVASGKVIVIDDGSDYGKGLGDGVRTEAEKLGVSLDKGESIIAGSPDLSSTIAKINAAKATVIYFAGYYSDGARLLKQLANPKITFVGSDGNYAKEFITQAGASAKGAIVTVPSAPLDATKAGKAFKAAYLSAFGQADGLYSAEAFDAANFFLAGIKGNKTTRATLQKYVSTAAYVGITKTLKFGSNGELSGGAIYAYTVQADGTWKAQVIK